MLKQVDHLRCFCAHHCSINEQGKTFRENPKVQRVRRVFHELLKDYKIGDDFHPLFQSFVCAGSHCVTSSVGLGCDND